MELEMLVESIDVDSDFAYLLTLLPEGWQEKAKELGALRRRREIPDAETLLRLLLIHLAEGVSLRQTAVLASQSKIAHVSDVAIMDRLKQSGEWFRWMNSSLLESMNVRASEHVFGTKRRVRLVDATMISEPGPTGSSWRINYAIELALVALRRVYRHGAPWRESRRKLSAFRNRGWGSDDRRSCLWDAFRDISCGIVRWRCAGAFRMESPAVASAIGQRL